MALPFVLNAKFDLELILYITIFVFLSPGNCFKSAICIQNSLESATIVLFSPRLKEGKIFLQKGLRTPFTLVFHSETTKTSNNNAMIQVLTDTKAMKLTLSRQFFPIWLPRWSVCLMHLESGCNENYLQ